MAGRAGDDARRTLRKVLAAPTAADLWKLRGDLLQAGLDPGSSAWRVLDEFHGFLDRLVTGSASRDLSHLASLLDIGAVGGVVLEELLEAEDPRELGLRLFGGLLSEGLMVLATRQHVRAWEGELGAVLRGAAWFLYGELWCWASALKPELEVAERRRLLDRLLAPALDPGMPGEHRAVLVGRLFQILLVTHLARDLR